MNTKFDRNFFLYNLDVLRNIKKIKDKSERDKAVKTRRHYFIELKKQGWTLEQIANKFNISRQMVHFEIGGCRKQKLPLNIYGSHTKEMESEEFWKKNKSLEEIAEKHNVTTSAVRNWRKKFTKLPPQKIAMVYRKLEKLNLKPQPIKHSLLKIKGNKTVSVRIHNGKNNKKMKLGSSIYCFANLERVRPNFYIFQFKHDGIYHRYIMNKKQIGWRSTVALCYPTGLHNSVSYWDKFRENWEILK